VTGRDRLEGYGYIVGASELDDLGNQLSCLLRECWISNK
jgi:hypothetical protein